LRVDLIDFQSLKYRTIELNPKCTYGFIHNTLVYMASIHEGLQSVLFIPTDSDVYIHNGGPLYTDN
jgi:hypothetical protein